MATILNSLLYLGTVLTEFHCKPFVHSFETFKMPFSECDIKSFQGHNNIWWWLTWLALAVSKAISMATSAIDFSLWHLHWQFGGQSEI